MPAESSMKGHQQQVCVSLPPEYVNQLKVLSELTHEPMAHFFREALRDLFEKHRKTLGLLASGQKPAAHKRLLRRDSSSTAIKRRHGGA